MWAQTLDTLLVTVQLAQEKDTIVKLQDDHLTISGKKDGNDYECTVKFYKPIKASEAMKSNDRFLRFKLPKADKEKWPTLNSDGKKHWIKIDWDRWVDSDAEDDDAFNNGFDMSNFDQFAGMGDGGFDDDFMPEDNMDECCDQGDCACDSCDCSTLCKCGTDCKCENCSCVADCNCDAACLGGRDAKSGCDCCDDCSCGDDCRCTPENKCSPACKCDTACSSKGAMKSGCDGCDDCSCGSDCKCTPENKCNPACNCAA
ncbi:Uncharacterized protein BXIN_1174 [Babesia sp. Xinjiang]|uniref:Uncharacterized protein n=1 Tax=Babesia sp. Xinjiang TaxID=462227 RepID=UPI000A25740B|nr:Uncharacterized protein BXIN_1174 [Babesia sp. Xinjiang]ORM40205.1 Uncharacterized protein BXIN_1174 [Babesia sp. Xinjiang]